MSLGNVKSVQKIQNVIMIHFTQPDTSPWGDTTSVTFPVTDAKKLLDKIQKALHPKAANR